MFSLSGNAYLWIKVLHLISVIAWMAGLLYLPRLFVYHVNAKKGGELSETLKIMERRLLKFIMNPAMYASIIFGILLMINLGDEIWSEGWLYAKLIFVFSLMVIHMAMAKWHRNFVNNNNTRSQKFFRIINEVPTLLMIGIIIFVIIQPF
jgi:putative membrane protein